MSFDIGDKVVCIDAGIEGRMLGEIINDFPNWLEQDAEYTIREFNDNDGIVTGVLLEEIINPEKYFRLVNKIQEPAFRLSRFRKKEEAYIDPYEIEETKVVNLEIEDYSYDSYNL